MGSVGLGWVARELWLPLFDAAPGFELVGAVDPDAAAVSAATARLPGLPVCADLEDLLARRPGLVVVATPNHLHAALAELLLKEGISVFVEKPVCLTADEVRRLRDAAAAGGGRLVASAAARHRSDVRALLGLLENGVLGDPRLVELEWVRARGIPRPGSWFTARARAGGGAMIDLGWHLLDLGLAALGHPEIKQVAAVESGDHLRDGGFAAHWRGDTGAAPAGPADVEDSATAFLATADGVGILCRAAWASHEPCDVTRIAIHGTRAAATLRTTFGFSTNRVERASLVLRREGEARELELPDQPRGAEYGRQLDRLVPLLSEPGCAERHLREALCVVDVMERIYAAARAARAQAEASS